MILDFDLTRGLMLKVIYISPIYFVTTYDMYIEYKSYEFKLLRKLIVQQINPYNI